MHRFHTGSASLSALALVVTLSTLTGCAVERVGLSGDAVPVQRAEQPLDPEWIVASANIDAKALKYGKRGAKPYNQPAERMVFFLDQRLPAGMEDYPIDHLEDVRRNVEARQAAIADNGGIVEADNAGNAFPRGGVPVASSSTGASAIEAWEPIGPGNIGGRTRGLVVNPVNPNILYAGGVAGGVWKSEDAGASWTPTGDTLINLAIASLAMDPFDPDTLYAGTGEGVIINQNNLGSAVRGLGIFKTTNGGDTWERLASTDSPDFYYVNEVALSEEVPGLVFAATRNGVFRSTNGGDDFELVQAVNGSFVGFTDVEIQPGSNPPVVLAASGSFFTDGLYRSTDAGDSWSKVSTGSPLDVFNQGRMNIEFAPSNPDVVYIAMADNGNLNETGRLVNVFRSSDAGLTWEPRVDLPTNFNQWLFTNTPFVTGCAQFRTISQGWYDNALAVDPVDEDIIWVGGIDLFRSEDGGRNFGLASYWYFDTTSTNYVHADHHALVFHPDYDGVNNQILYSGSDGGVARTSNARAATTPDGCPFDGGPLPAVTWEQLNNGYAITQFYHGDASPLVDRFVGGTQDNGSVQTNSTNPDVSWFEVLGGDGGYAQIDPTNPNILYVETQNFPTIEKSIDGGLTTFPAVNGITDEDGLFITPFIMDQNDPEVLWTGGRRIWRTTNGAASWDLVSDDLAGPDQLSAIGIAPTDSNTVYLGFDDGWVAKSTNALSANPNWELFGGANGLPAEVGFISWVEVDPTDPDIAYATTTTFGLAHVYKTENGGQTWVAIDGIEQAGIPDIPVHCLVVRPTEPSQLFAGTELGVFASNDGGASWFPANPGLPNTVVETLDFVTPDRLVAFTHGRSVFVTDLSPGAFFSLSASEGLPTLLAPNVATPITIDVTLTADAIVSGPTLSFRSGSTGPFTELPMSPAGDDSFTATLPGFGCDSPVEYFITAASADFGAVALPASGVVNAEIGAPVVAFADDFESELGWSVSGDIASDSAGLWEQGTPEGNDRGDPSEDADGSGQAWLTGITPGNTNSDVDNGTTSLLSPVLDAGSNSIISYAYWLNDTAAGPLQGGDSFDVEVSTDGGSTFTLVRSYTQPSGVWRTDSITAGVDFTASSQLVLRFSVSDESPQNIIEGGLDAFVLSNVRCVECPADQNGDGVVTGVDFTDFIANFGQADPLADINGDGVVTGVDFTDFITAFAAGCP